MVWRTRTLTRTRTWRLGGLALALTLAHGPGAWPWCMTGAWSARYLLVITLAQRGTSTLWTGMSTLYRPFIVQWGKHLTLCA